MWFTWLLLSLLLRLSHGLDVDADFELHRHRLERNAHDSQSWALSHKAIAGVRRKTQEDLTDANDQPHRLTRRGILGTYTTFMEFNEKFSKRVSGACYNAFFNSVTSVAGIFTGKFPSAIIYMIDSSGKTVSGSRRGSSIRKGSYHQCLMMVKDAQNGFEGNFCGVTAEYGQENSSHKLDYVEYQIYPTANRSTFGIELCIPSVCNNQDVKEMVMQVADTYYPDVINFEVTNVQCRQNTRRPISVFSIFVILVITSLALVLILGTAYDIWLSFQQHNLPALQKSGPFVRLLPCFSISRNMGFIMNHKDNGELVIPSVNGVRSLTLFWVILTNVYLVAKDRQWVNYMGFLEDLRWWPSQIIFNGRFAADTSFCIGGLLATYLTLKRFEMKCQYSILQYYLHRYLRLLPSYVIVILLTSGIYYYSADGPDWMSTNEYETACKQHWWKGLLFLNNFFRDTENCPAISWYLATDMQLHLIAPFIIYPLYRNPSVGLSLLVVMLLGFSAIPPLFIFAEKLPYFTGRLFYFELGHQEYIYQILMKPYSHAAPFLVGIFYGYLLYRNGMNSMIRLKVSLVFWLVATVTILVIIFGFQPYIDGTQKMSAITGILYAGLTPFLWAMVVGWIMYACATGNGGFVNYILSWGVYDVFSRISYCAYLLNFLAISHFFHSRPDNFYYDRAMMLTIIVGSLFITTISSIILSALVERPFHEMLKGLKSKTIKEVHHNASNGSLDEANTINVNNRAHTSKLTQRLRNYINFWAAEANSKSHNIFNNTQQLLDVAVHKQSDDKQPLITTT